LGILEGTNFNPNNQPPRKSIGDAENAGLEYAGPNMRHQIAGVEYAGLENTAPTWNEKK